MRIVTVSREFGSGGRELGKRLADELGVAYYDKEIIGMIAEKLQMDPHYIESVLERSYTIQYPYTFRSSFSLIPLLPVAQHSPLIEQTRIIQELAKKEDCVIVGRAADILLREHKPYSIFVYSDTEAKLKRCHERAKTGEQISDKEMLRHMKHIDKARAANYSLLADHKWGEREAYNLCINTSGLQIPELVKPVAQLARLWFK